MSNTPSKYDDVIDSRDVIARIEELTDERTALEDAALAASDALAEAETDEDRETAAETLKDAEAELRDWKREYGDELANLEALAKEGEGYAADWKHGETLIRDSYFKEYAMELAEDIGAIPNDAQWPCTCIDWDQAARELQMDYSAIDFDGVTYWVR